MTTAKEIKEVWAVESKENLEFCFGHTKAIASRRARVLGQIAKQYGPYKVVRFVRVSSERRNG